MPETPQTVAETYTNKKMSQQRKRRPNWKALLFVVIFFGLVLLAGFLNSPLSSVSSIEVKGNHQIRYEDIVQAAQIQKGESFWRINKADVANRITSSFPLVDSADVQVSLTGKVVIAVAEKNIAGVLMVKDKFYRILQDGTVMSSGNKLVDNVPIISMDNPPAVVVGKKVGSEDVQALVNQIPQVDRSVLDQISEIHITKQGPWVLYMRDKFEVHVPPREFAVKMKDYDRFRNALPKNQAPEIINLLESDYAIPFSDPQQKGGS